MTWLLQRLSAPVQDENKRYSAELLSILLQNNRQNRLAFGDKGGVDTLLKVLSVSGRRFFDHREPLILIRLQHYRRRDPADADEAEFMENVFDTLCSALIEPEIKEIFLKEEGIDLMVLIMKSAFFYSSQAVK